MHDKNNNEESFVIMLDFKNIKKKRKRFLLISKSRKALAESVFNLYIRKFINYFSRKKKISRNECNKLKTRFIKPFINL